MSIVSTLFVISVLGYIVVNLPGWELVQESFLNPTYAASAWPKIWAAFGRNVEIAGDAGGQFAVRAVGCVLELYLCHGDQLIISANTAT